jgi:hypothetical protein
VEDASLEMLVTKEPFTGKVGFKFHLVTLYYPDPTCRHGSRNKADDLKVKYVHYNQE